jgi:hypothetical protein
MVEHIVAGGVPIAVLIGVIYWVNRCFMPIDLCKKTQQCLEGKLDKLCALTEQEFEHIKSKLDDMSK